MSADKISRHRCCASGCDKDGHVVLKVHYVNKIGHFCGACADYCIQEGLATRATGGR